MENMYFILHVTSLTMNMIIFQVGRINPMESMNVSAKIHGKESPRYNELCTFFMWCVWVPCSCGVSVCLIMS